MGDSFSKTYEKLQRKFFREKVNNIWNMLKSGRIEELSEKDSKLAAIILSHQEYRDHFENTDILDGREYDAGMTFNPFLHISMHQMVEDQLSANSPIEAAFFCETLEDKGLSRHDAIHFIIMILVRVIFDSASNQKPFDAPRYKRLLTECRTMEPPEIQEWIEEEFSSHKYRSDLH
jgi:hypothetical protein